MLEKEGGALCGHNLKGELFVSLDLNVQSRSVVGNREKISKLDNYCLVSLTKNLEALQTWLAFCGAINPSPRFCEV